MTTGCLMKVKSIAECSKGSIHQYFWPALSDNWSSEWPFYTGFTVQQNFLCISFHLPPVNSLFVGNVSFFFKRIGGVA